MLNVIGLQLALKGYLLDLVSFYGFHNVPPALPQSLF